MCSVCMMTPCHPSCPNAPESEPLYICSVCGKGIYGGDKYYRDLGEVFCEGCIDNMSAEEVLGLFGESLRTA